MARHFKVQSLQWSFTQLLHARVIDVQWFFALVQSSQYQYRVTVAGPNKVTWLSTKILRPVDACPGDRFTFSSNECMTTAVVSYAQVKPVSSSMQYHDQLRHYDYDFRFKCRSKRQHCLPLHFKLNGVNDPVLTCVRVQCLLLTTIDVNLTTTSKEDITLAPFTRKHGLAFSALLWQDIRPWVLSRPC